MDPSSYSSLTAIPNGIFNHTSGTWYGDQRVLVSVTYCRLAYSTKLRTLGRQIICALSKRPCSVCRRQRSSDAMGIESENRTFLHNARVNYWSYKKCRRKYGRKLPDQHVPNTVTFHKHVKGFQATGPILYRKRTRTRQVFTEEKLGKIDTRSNIPPTKSLDRVPQ